MGERKIEQKQIQFYLMEKPLSLSVLHILITQHEGLTATQLAHKLHMSVPTLHRLTLEMYNLGLLENKKEGKKIVYKITNFGQEIFPNLSTYGSYNNKLQNKIDKLTLTKTVAEKYNIPLNFKVTEHLIISVLKEKIIEKLPTNIYQKKLGTIETLLNETLRFDLYVGSNNKHIALEIKVIETIRGLLERIGTMATIDLTKSSKLNAIIIVHILSPIGNQSSITDDTIEKMINNLNSTNRNFIYIIRPADRYKILDTQFLDKLSSDIIDKVREMLFNE